MVVTESDVLVQIGRSQAGGQRLRDRFSAEQVHETGEPLLFLNDVSAFRDVELESARWNRLVGLDPGEQDIGALADAVDQAHVIDHAVTERKVQAVEQRVLGFRLEGEFDHVAGLLGGDVEAVVNLRHITRQQQRRRLIQARVELLDSRLFQIRVPK